MKILFVLNSIYANGNGLSASARRTVKYLKETGHDVRVLSGPNMESDLPQPDFPLKHFTFPLFEPIIVAEGYSFASGDPQRIEEAVKWADDVHLEEAFVLQLKTIRLCKKLGVPLTITYHLHPENIFYALGMGSWTWANEAMLHFWRDKVYNHCIAIQCPTENVRKRLEKEQFAARLEVISNGVIPDKCIRPETPPADYEDPDRPLKVVYIGRLAAEKDHYTLFEAMKYSTFARRIQLICAGQGPQAKVFKKKARKLYEDGVLRYEPIFRFCNRDDLRTLAAEADLCVHCAVVEVEGLSIMEAMQQAVVPVIAEGPITGTSQFALDERSIFPQKDAKVLAERIDYWLSHPKERWEMGRRYAASMKQYDIRESSRKLLNMFQYAIDKQKEQ